MDYPSLSRFKSMDDFQTHWQGIGSQIDAMMDLNPANLGPAGPMAQPIAVHGRTLANRFCIHPMEGWDATSDGGPTEPTLRRWRRFGQSGAKLIWGGEAFAVEERGRANPNQLYLDAADKSVGHLESLRSSLREGHAELGEDPDSMYVGLQLTHSGRFARPFDSKLHPRVAFHHPVLEKKYDTAGSVHVLTDGELEAIGERFVVAARCAQQAGYDFVDVKCCHGYLLHEVLAGHTRPGPYGGSFENRTRLFRRIVEAIRADSPGLVIGVRLSAVDCYPFVSSEETGLGIPMDAEPQLPYDFGFGVDPNHPLQPDYAEPIRFLELLQSLDIELVNLSVGSPYYCPHLQRPAAFPPSDGYQPPEDPLLSVARQLEVVRRCKQAVPGLKYVGSGYSYLQQFLPYVAQYEVENNHTDFVGLGRMVLSYPEMVADFLQGKPMQRKKICRTFSDCTTGPRHGKISGCFPLDDYYRSMPLAAEIRKLRPKK